MAKQHSYKIAGTVFIRKTHGNDIIKGTCPLLTMTLWQCIAIWKGEMSDTQNGIAVLRAFKHHD